MEYDQKEWAALATKVSTTSVMNPTLLLCVITCPLTLIGAITLFYMGQPIPAFALLAVCLVPLSIACWQISYFTRHDPDRLQREEHNQRMFELRNRLTVKDGDSLKEITISSNITDNPLIEDRSGE